MAKHEATPAVSVQLPVLCIETHGRAVVVKGDTRTIKDFLKTQGGKWNRALAGWIFPGSKCSQLLSNLQSHGVKVDAQIEGAGDDDYIQVTDTIQASISSVQDKPGVDVRNFQKAEDGQIYPAVKGGNLQSHGVKVDAEIEGVGDDDYIQVTDTIRASISSFRGKTSIDVRKFKKADDGQIYPTVKGIRFSRNEWVQLCQEEKLIDAACGSECDSQLKLDNKLVVNVKSLSGQGPKGVDIRRLYNDKHDGTQKPSKKGIWLSQTDWSSLKASMRQLAVAGRIPA